MDTGSPKISVIIPVYDVEQYLSACLDSVLAQTFQDFEVICVNDGSPDKCGEILDRYAKRDKRIKVITQNNQGVSVARNNALKQVKGDYVCFLDSDDEVAPTFLEKMVQAIQQTKADVGWCECQQGKTRKDWSLNHSSICVYSDVFERFLQEKPHMFMSMCNKIYRSSLFVNKTFSSSLAIAEDLLLLHEVLFDAQRIVHVPEVLYWYRQQEDSVMHEKFSEKIIDGNCGAAIELWHYFKNQEMAPKTRKILNKKIAKRLFKFCVLEPKRKDSANLGKWYAKTRPLLMTLKEKGIYQPKYLSLKNQFKSWIFLKGKTHA